MEEAKRLPASCCENGEVEVEEVRDEEKKEGGSPPLSTSSLSHLAVQVFQVGAPGQVKGPDAGRREAVVASVGGWEAAGRRPMRRLPSRMR